jgi:hypothetical protein
LIAGVRWSSHHTLTVVCLSTPICSITLCIYEVGKNIKDCDSNHVITLSLRYHKQTIHTQNYSHQEECFAKGFVGFGMIVAVDNRAGGFALRRCGVAAVG